MPFVSHGQWVAPGDALCAAEELAPGPGTYEDENGIIRASIAGEVKIDMINYMIEVRGKNAERRLLQPKETVYAEVIAMRNELAQVRVARTPEEALKARAYSGVIHISQLARPAQSLYEAFRPGEILKVRVISGPPYQLTLKGPRLGVILAYCSVCGHPLQKVDGQLQCPNCGHVEERHLSPDYIFKAGPPHKKR